MDITLRSLADFKRFLAQPGATVQIIRNDWSDPTKTSHPINHKAGYWDAKQVQKLQSKTVQFTSGGWLQFGKASNVRFDGDTATFCMNQDGTFSQVLVYKCWIAEAAMSEPQFNALVSTAVTRRALAHLLLDAAEAQGKRIVVAADPTGMGRLGYCIDGGAWMTPGETATALGVEWRQS